MIILKLDRIGHNLPDVPRRLDSYVAIEASHCQSPMFELMMVFLIEARVEIQMLCW